MRCERRVVVVGGTKYHRKFKTSYHRSYGLCPFLPLTCCTSSVAVLQVETYRIYLAASDFTGVFTNLALILEFISKTDWCIVQSGRLGREGNFPRSLKMVCEFTGFRV